MSRAVSSVIDGSVMDRSVIDRRVIGPTRMTALMAVPHPGCPVRTTVRK